MIITISGRPGAGKGSLKDMVSYFLKFPGYSVGDLRGEMARRHGMDIDAFNKLGERDSETDKLMDEEQMKMGAEQTNFIMEGRLSWYFIPNSFKIFLDVEEHIGAERILKSKRTDEIIETDLDSEVARLRMRKESDCKRYQKWYNLDFSNPRKEWFDFWLDTSFLSQQEVFSEVMIRYSGYIQLQKNRKTEGARDGN